MPIRCRNFDDDGEPVKRGCMKGDECAFVHPNHAGWAQAIRRQNSDANSNRPSGSSNSRGNPARASWGGPPKSPSKDWDTTLWDSTSSTSKKSDDNSTARKWGSSMQSPVRQDTAPQSPISNDWNRPSDKGEANKSGTEVSWWGNNTTDSWAVDGSVGWGGGGGGGEWGSGNGKGNGGWGDSGGEGGWGDSGGGRWGNAGAKASGGDVGEGWDGGKAGDDTSRVSHNNNGLKSKEKEIPKEDVEMRDSSPPRTKPIPLSDNKPKSAAPPPPPRDTTHPSTVASKPARPLPLPLPSRQKKIQPFEDGNLTKMALQSMKRADKEPQQASLSTRTARGPKGRVDLFSQVIKQTSAVVLSQLELQRAQRDHVRWKRTQESAQYERASPATRVILDHHRAQLNLRVQEAKRRLDRTLTALIELPDLASRNRKTPGPLLTKQTIAAYTAELRDWFSDLELHKRILVEKAAAQAELPPTPVQDTSVTPVEPQLTARQLMERGKWSWNDIKNATNELDTRVLSTAEHLYSDVYTTISDLKEQAVGLQDPRQIRPPATSRENQYGALSSTTNLVGDNVSVQAVRTAELISKIHELEQEREQLENEKRAMDKLCSEAEVQFSQFEQWKLDDRAKIQEIAEQLRKLHLRRQTPKTLTATLQPAQLDGILLHMRPTVIEQLQKEVQPIFDALRSRCLENHEGMKSLIEELVTPALVMTDDICHRVSAMMLRIPGDN